MNGAVRTAIDQSGAPVPFNRIPSRGRPPKRNKLAQVACESIHATAHQHMGNTFIMKLFDRSLDLAKFDSKSPLYPVCRAWMQNKPRPRHLFKKPLELPAPEKCQRLDSVLQDLQSGRLVEVHSMPTVKEHGPQLLERPEAVDLDLDMHYDASAPLVGRDALLADLKRRSKEESYRWKTHNKIRRAQAYTDSFRVLKSLYKPSSD